MLVDEIRITELAPGQNQRIVIGIELKGTHRTEMALQLFDQLAANKSHKLTTPQRLPTSINRPA